MSAVTVPSGTVVPGRSLQQRMDALERANDIRSYRASLKGDVKLGRQPGRVFLCGARELDSMKVYDVLLALPKVGRVKANKILGRCRISPSKTVGGLTERQRRELVASCPWLR